METDVVCAIVVTYHPDAEVMTNLAALRFQVGRMVVVDNGSTAGELGPLREAAKLVGFELIENGKNLGIATALNTGVHRAEAMGFAWVLLFDQDSTITPNCAATMLQDFQTRPDAARMGILNSRYVDSRFGNELKPYVDKDGVLETAITSGSLMPMRIFKAAGYFADELFIDGVDYEYSFRVRALGYFIGRCAEATVLHSPGTPAYHSLLGSKKFQVANYSPIRRYYQERNKIWTTRRYWRQFHRFLLLQFRISVKDFVKIVLVEEDSWRKVRFFLWGVFDGLREKMGPCELR